ncbi:MAG: hypothetical protein GX159_02230 [Flavobacteriaceae bacterium]|jgi:hypothetical protein|nr:hypothetical protein [Flavobacteriaceae bacterium]
MSEFLTELFTGLILEGTIGQNIRFYFFKLFGIKVAKEKLANEVVGSEKPHRQKNYNILVGFIALIFLISFILGMTFLIFGK